MNKSYLNMNRSFVNMNKSFVGGESTMKVSKV